MSKVQGFYNAKFYCIEVDGEEVYRAGNAHGCSQTYVSASNGVGLAKMKAYCEQTAQETAEEEEAEYAGIIFLKA